MQAERQTPIEQATKTARRTEGFLFERGIELYCIPSYDRMPPFLMTLTSDSDHWIYLSSYGGLTAGRFDEEHCLFPYETEDRLHEAHGVTGPQTILRVLAADGSDTLWEPFNHRGVVGPVERNLYRAPLGNLVIFEEIQRELELVFRYRWAASERFGFVRTSSIRNFGKEPRSVDLLDGLLNIMPQGVKLRAQQSASCLVDAYKQCELDAPSGLAVYSLTSMVQDRAEPAECLKATVAWSRGLSDPEIHLSAECVRAFREGRRITPEEVVAGKRAAFMLQSSVVLESGQEQEWDIVSDVDQDHVSIERLRQLLQHGADLRLQVAQSLRDGHENLFRQVASADGLQCTGERRASAHHAANVLFNNMRGGVPLDQYNIAAADFARFVRSRNADVARVHEDFLARLNANLRLPDLLKLAESAEDPNLLRLAYEYLPLTFGRRHGDPSRPWNHFNIRLKNPDGSAAIQYQGNWRDIFQNWEALAISFPELLESFIAKFANASTVDGFNAYHIGSDGIDWETHNPDDLWSNIGYWGDHQIIYLLRLLELSQRYHPGALERLLDRQIFSYANVPYRLKPYAQIVSNPNATIEFDGAAANETARRVENLGADGKLVASSSGAVYHVNLFEKLLVPLLSKLSNFVIGGGIWMNTQRPEWNDANNALVGNGLSVVTVCHLRRYVSFLLALLEPISEKMFSMSSEVVGWMDAICEVLAQHIRLEATDVSDEVRLKILDELGEVFGTYRARVYADGFTGIIERQAGDALALLKLAEKCLDDTIRTNRRPDGLYHSYNLLQLGEDRASFRRLEEMLEGQVAALSSGVLSLSESAELMEALFRGRMFRDDQQSFMLYPRRTLPRFLDRNKIPRDATESIDLVRRLVDAGDASVIVRDSTGAYRFSGGLRNAADLERALDRLARDSRFSSQVMRDRAAVVHLFESVFNHRAFIGRAAAMYAYEGIGCVYWHMVSKLLLAAQETHARAVDQAASVDLVERLAECYDRIRAGLGFNKTARQFGAFPIDPYSHTSAFGGARQPGMTGQVKEQILTRFGELGVSVRDGVVHIAPRLLRRREFLQAPAEWHYVPIDGRRRSLQLSAGSLAFTLCQVPVIYQLSEGQTRTIMTYADGIHREVFGERLNETVSSLLFNRSGSIDRIDVALPASQIRD